ncbi:hypothetical protein H0H93_015965 [Arthromyces matolae]|nr:hypothetical protein H0H93_015965 [Arthromyces matolae]
MPVELLRTIFSLLSTCMKFYLNPIVEFQSLILASGNAGPELDDDNSDNHFLFNYTLALVCSRWKNIVFGLPELWTRVTVSTIYAPFEFVQPLLQRSCPLPVDITIASPQATISDGLERCDVQALLCVISPHLSRCHKLCFDLEDVGAAPRILTDLTNISDTLSVLSLKARTKRYPWRFDIPQSPSLPRLTSLVELELDADNFIELQQLQPIDWFEGRRGRRISVCFHKRDAGSEEFDPVPLFDYIPFIAKFDTVVLRSLEVIHPDSYDVQPFEINSLILSDLEEDVLGTLLDFLRPKELYAEFCSITVVIEELPHKLTFTGLFPEDVEALELLLGPDWDGTSLTLIDCPGVQKYLFEVLSLRGGSLGIVNAPKLENLTLRGCRDFPFEALRHMVEVRREESSGRPFNFSVTDGPQMNEEESLWYKLNASGL